MTWTYCVKLQKRWNEKRMREKKELYMMGHTLVIWLVVDTTRTCYFILASEETLLQCFPSSPEFGSLLRLLVASYRARAPPGE